MTAPPGQLIILQDSSVLKDTLCLYQNISLLEIIANSDQRHGLEFDCNEEVSLFRGAALINFNYSYTVEIEKACVFLNSTHNDSPRIKTK